MPTIGIRALVFACNFLTFSRVFSYPCNETQNGEVCLPMLCDESEICTKDTESEVDDVFYISHFADLNVALMMSNKDAFYDDLLTELDGYMELVCQESKTPVKCYHDYDNDICVVIYKHDCASSDTVTCHSFKFQSSIVYACDGSELTVSFRTNDTVFIQRSFRTDSNTVADTLIITNSISLGLCLIAIFLYLRVAGVRRFPSVIIFYRLIIMAGLSINFLLLELRKKQFKNSDLACNFMIAFITQLGLGSALGYFFVLILNFYFSVTNPFVHPAAKLPLYNAGVMAISVSLALVTAFNSGYREDFSLCWNAPTEFTYNWSNWVTYFCWVIGLGCLGTYLLIHTCTRFTSNIDLTSASRVQILKETKYYIFVFSVYFFAAGIPFAYLNSTSTGGVLQENVEVALAFAIISGSMGSTDALAFFFIQLPIFLKKKQNSQDENLNEPMNDMSALLRQDFILKTSEGRKRLADRQI